MKFNLAALAFVASVPATAAFAPKSFGVSQSRQQHTRHGDHHIDTVFGIRNGKSKLLSTTDKEEIDLSSLEKLVQLTPKETPFSLTEQEKIVFSRTPEELRASIRDMMSRYEGQNGAHVIYSKLQENGVKVVNGFSGGAVLPLLDQFHLGHPRHSEPNAPTPIRWITNSNENSAGHIAEGYAKALPMNQEHLPVGVVVATSGPGVTNLITPLQDAICDGVPMVVLCGQAATTAPLDAFQSAPAVDLCKPCTKWSYQIKSAAELPLVLDYAFFLARNGRPGPVYVDLPKDLQNQVITKELVDNFVNNNFSAAPKTDSFARVEERKTIQGQPFQALNLGYDSMGLPFYLAKQGDTYKVKLVPHSTMKNSYHTDHMPTDSIYQTANNVPNSLQNVGSLKASDPMFKDMMNLILKAKKPVIIAGQGCNDSPEELKEFAETLKIPVTTTLHALGCFDERHPLALNMLGMHGHPTPNFMVQECDLLICIGSRFDDRITGRLANFLPEARKAAEEGRGGIIHCDLRLTEKSKQVKPTIFVHSTGKNFLQTINACLRQAPRKPVTGAWLNQMKELQRDFPVKIPHFPTQNVMVEIENGTKEMLSRTRMSAQSVIAEMNKQLLNAGKIDDCIFTTGVGVHQMIAAQLITWTQPRQMLSSGSLGTMGVSLGYVIGAKLARDDKWCISVDGDGSFNMTFTELKTLAEQGIPVKLLILDNDGQMMVEYWQRLFHDNRLLAVRNTANPDYVQLAKAFGIKSVYCDNEEEIQDKMRQFLFEYDDEPVLFHARIERTPCLPLVAPGQPLEDMILEDIEVEVDPGAAPS
jgi:acetolactate synthase I/II/III large subunit